MIKRTAKFAARMLIKFEVVPQSSENVYIYGLELLLSSIAGVFSLILISIVMQKPLAWLPYLAAFVPLRIKGGGYHAKSHIGCIFTFSVAFIVLLCSLRWTIGRYFLAPLVATLVLATALGFAPVEAKNKQLTPDQKSSNRKKCLYICIANLFLSIIGMLLRWHDFSYYIIYFMGVIAAGFSMIVAVIINRISQNYYERRTSIL